RPITLGVLALLLAAPPNWAAAEGADPCALLARQFDAAGYDNGVGRRWTTDQTDNVPIYGVLGANALPAVDVSGKLYDLAGKKVGGYDKLPSPWTDAIDLDAEMAKLLGGRKFGDALANIEFGGMLSAVSVPTEPERLVLFQSAGTMNCLVWSTFVAEGGHWRP